MALQLTLGVLPDVFTICQLAPTSAIPDWATGSFVSITRCRDELSIVCPLACVPELMRGDRWRCLQVAGPLDFSLIGILAALASPLAEANIPIFAISTYNTDYLLVKEEYLEQAIAVLSQAGHRIS
ncbi:MAG: ACT domain-containing protein [Cyanophyceae cyanobacterium]